MWWLLLKGHLGEARKSCVSPPPQTQYSAEVDASPSSASFCLFPSVPCDPGLCIRELVKACDHAQTLVLHFLGVRPAMGVKKDQDWAASRACIPNTRFTRMDWPDGAVGETPMSLPGDHPGECELCPCGIQNNQPISLIRLQDRDVRPTTAQDKEEVPWWEEPERPGIRGQPAPAPSTAATQAECLHSVSQVSDGQKGIDRIIS